jgi:NADPH:quinone reductase-like Zn-dependent oxidoreductase
MPRKLVAVAPRKAALVDYEEPTAGRTQVKVRVEYASPKHGTEVSLFRGDDPFVADLFDEDWRLFLQREPGSQEAENGEDPALGNQWVGVIVEKGDDVARFRVGDRVCGYGSIREIQVLDAVDDPYLLKVPDIMPWKNALCFDPRNLPSAASAMVTCASETASPYSASERSERSHPSWREQPGPLTWLSSTL